MNCPKCESTNIGPFSHEGVEFDFCSDCKGIWCDHGELANYVETIDDHPERTDLEKEGTLTKLTCPKCTTKTLYEMPYQKSQNLLIDKCLTCSGLWLDFKELATIQKLAVNIDAKGKLERTIKRMKDKGFALK